MTLVAHCIGLTDQELNNLNNFKTRASVRIITQNGLTVINARGIYDDLLELVNIITSFKTFEVNLK